MLRHAHVACCMPYAGCQPGNAIVSPGLQIAKCDWICMVNVAQGWKLFAEAHNVDQGDQYSFEMVEDDSGQSRLVIQLLTKAGQAGVDIQAEAEARYHSS